DGGGGRAARARGGRPGDDRGCRYDDRPGWRFEAMKILQRFAEDGTQLPQSALDVPALIVPLTDAGLAMVAAHVRDAVELMHFGCGNARGVAMAFPQIGVSLAAFVFCPTGQRGTERVFVNPTWRPTLVFGFELDALAGK